MVIFGFVLFIISFVILSIKNNFNKNAYIIAAASYWIFMVFCLLNILESVGLEEVKGCVIRVFFEPGDAFIQCNYLFFLFFCFSYLFFVLIFNQENFVEFDFVSLRGKLYLCYFGGFYCYMAVILYYNMLYFFNHKFFYTPIFYGIAALAIVVILFFFFVLYKTMITNIFGEAFRLTSIAFSISVQSWFPSFNMLWLLCIIAIFLVWFSVLLPSFLIEVVFPNLFKEIINNKVNDNDQSEMCNFYNRYIVKIYINILKIIVFFKEYITFIYAYNPILVLGLNVMTLTVLASNSISGNPNYFLMVMVFLFFNFNVVVNVGYINFLAEVMSSKDVIENMEDTDAVLILLAIERVLNLDKQFIIFKDHWPLNEYYKSFRIKTIEWAEDTKDNFLEAVKEDSIEYLLEIKQIDFLLKALDTLKLKPTLFNIKRCNILLYELQKIESRNSELAESKIFFEVAMEQLKSLMKYNNVIYIAKADNLVSKIDQLKSNIYESKFFQRPFTYMIFARSVFLYLF